MSKDLTQSPIDRQNLLNNAGAVEKIQEFTGLTGLLYNGEYLFTTKMVADFYGVSTRTISNILNDHEDEVKHNGYQLLRGAKLKEFKELFGPLLIDGDDIELTDIDQSEPKQHTGNQSYKYLRNLGVFNFRAFLNVGMLLTESEQAKMLRSKMLDIVIDVLNEKLGGSTKFINQRDDEFLVAIAKEPIYRKEFTNALNLYLEMGNYKYAYYTDAIYKAIFTENAMEYKTLLSLEDTDNLRDTLYSEVLNVIASFEVGIADEMKEKSVNLGRRLKPAELDHLIISFAGKRHWVPQLEHAREVMASRDYVFRNVNHDRLERYKRPMTQQEYDQFLGDKSKKLIDRIKDTPELLDVFKRLRDR